MVIIHYFEDSLESDHSSCSSFCEHVSQFLDELVVAVLNASIVNSVSTLVVL